MSTTPNLSLPYILAAQSQKHVTHNEAIRALDTLLQLTALDKDLAAPPGAPAEGARYIVAASPTGAWTGQAGKIAAWQDGAWAFYAPKEGWLAWIADENKVYVHDGAAWVEFSGGGGGGGSSPVTHGADGLMTAADKRKLDAQLFFKILDKDLATPPGSPVDGDTYIVASGATGVWAGQDGKVAARLSGAWHFMTPAEGWIGWVADEFRIYRHNGAAWADLLQNLAFLGVNSAADTTNRLAVSSPATLFSHAGNGHQLKLNKNAAADTASFLFQDNFSGRAEIGLTGDDDFHFKVSPDGGAFNEGMKIDKTTGIVTFPSGVTLPAASAVRRRAYAEYKTYASATAGIPFDDTIPQNTEGTQVMSVTITPRTASKRIRVSGVVMMGAAALLSGCIALFRDGGADAIYVSVCRIDTVNRPIPMPFLFEDAPATTSPVTYNVRAAVSTGTYYFNGTDTARVYGGALACTLVAEEIEP